jgi:hypothetical protein
MKTQRIGFSHSWVMNPIVLPLISWTIAACGHGAPERFATIGDYDTPVGGHVTIALRSFEVDRPAIGLSAWPDGGIGIGLDQGVEVNICDRAAGKFQQIAVLHEPVKSSQSSATPMILEWLDTALRISHYTGGDTVIRLPNGFRVGTPPKKMADRTVLPECEESLKALRSSRRMPDGQPVTPDSIQG